MISSCWFDAELLNFDLNQGDLMIFEKYGVDNNVIDSPAKEKDQASHAAELMRKFDQSKDLKENMTSVTKKQTINTETAVPSNESSSGKGVLWSTPSTPKTATVDHTVNEAESKKDSADESGKSCELRFGAYCLWREQHREVVKDSLVKKLKDRLFVARAYYPSIAKMPTQDTLSTELKQNIQDFERVLSESTIDSDLPAQIENKLERMETAIAKAKSCPVECQNVDKKFRQLLDLTEDEANFHMKQSAFLHQVAVQTIPKSLHCLYMRLTVDYFKSTDKVKVSEEEKYSDPLLHHFVIFSNNLIASSVVINSTVLHSEESQNLVFHVLTDQENFFAMEQWFSGKAYGEAAVQVLNFEKLDLQENGNLLPLPNEFRVSFHVTDGQAILNLRTEYLSTFSHSHFLLPEIFPKLNKIVILDDDVVVQRDLAPLWVLNMGGKANGAVQSCAVKLGQLGSFLGGEVKYQNSCAWMSGLNVIDLSRWRDLDLSKVYRTFVQQLKSVEGSAESAALGATLLTFQDQIYALDNSWMLTGLGHDYGLKLSDVKSAAVLHYNGNMKPWLELGIRKYKHYWKRFLNWEEQILSDCNISP
ncbi:hypothetical protein SAY86_024921 [Trapa natans]|uniref:Hexosyltransferase n=1 Tax=Trapa natans TaxID=22666 RepID=A0AAN7M6S1_TRANT|nr:hypothetical protein SAY86_024921 [Trapa natans]